MKAGQKLWKREELILAINLYCKLPFGKFHRNNPEVIRLANIIGRTPSSVGLKLGNFASFDANLKARGIKGASNASKLDKEIWDEFNTDWSRLAFESEVLLAKYAGQSIEKSSDIDMTDFPIGMDRQAMVKQRVNQSFFRVTILTAYNHRCCITGFSIPELLVASHIIPWSKDEKNRLNPHNGICLNAVHDKAFDRGLITITADYKMKVSGAVYDKDNDAAVKDFFLKYQDSPIHQPDRFLPSKEFLDYHATHIFRG